LAITTGFITGTGFYTLPNIKDVRAETVTTPFGEVDVELGKLGDQEIVFIARHGKQHTIAPSSINYRANLYAMHLLGVERILATSVTGSLVPTWKPGTLILIDQFINFTTDRIGSIYPLDGKLAHVDVTDPYCPTLHDHLITNAQDMGLNLQLGATYACFSGPRFETRAEIDLVRRLGGHLVGQTNYPECVFARELAMCYATVGVVSNLAAGMQAELTATEVSANLKDLGDTISTLFERVVLGLPGHYDCSCRHALDEAYL
jgi:5'-methylthioadenosine phosphorylase